MAASVLDVDAQTREPACSAWHAAVGETGSMLNRECPVFVHMFDVVGGRTPSVLDGCSNLHRCRFLGGQDFLDAQATRGAVSVRVFHRPFLSVEDVLGFLP